MSCPKRIRSERGFTLVELVSIMAIAAVLVVLAVMAAGPLIGNESGRGAVIRDGDFGVWSFPERGNGPSDGAGSRVFDRAD